MHHHLLLGISDYGVELTDSPENLAKAGKFHKVPILLGTNANEGSIFSQLSHFVTADEYEADVIQKFGQEIGQQVLSYYPASNFSSPWWASVYLNSDASFSCPARRSARWLSKQVPVYLYFFTHVITETKVDPFLGAFHGVELPFVFAAPNGYYFGFPMVFTPWEVTFQQKVSRYWSQFAITGNPNLQGLPTWPEYNESTDSNIVLDETISSVNGLKQAACDFWDTLPY